MLRFVPAKFQSGVQTFIEQARRLECAKLALDRDGEFLTGEPCGVEQRLDLAMIEKRIPVPVLRSILFVEEHKCGVRVGNPDGFG